MRPGARRVPSRRWLASLPAAHARARSPAIDGLAGCRRRGERRRCGDFVRSTRLRDRGRRLSLHRYRHPALGSDFAPAAQVKPPLPHGHPDVAAYVDSHLPQFLGSRSNGAIAHYVIYGQHELRPAFDLVGQPIDLGYTVDLGG
jgi:hypothetical protein